MDVLVTAPTLMLGIGAFIWVPISLALGRRPVSIFCTILLTLATVWAATAQTFQQLLGAICLQGLAAGSILSLVSHRNIWKMYSYLYRHRFYA